MNLATAITELQARGGSYLSSARCTTFLNDAKNEFEDFWDWPWLEGVATGTAPMTLTDLRNILYVVDTTNKTVLTGVSANDIIATESADIDQTGIPYCWWLNGTYILEVFPKNTTVSLSVRYTSFTAELSGTETPDIPPRYHNLWIDLAMVRVYVDADELDKAEALRATTQRRLGQLVAEFEVRNHQNGGMQQATFGAADW